MKRTRRIGSITLGITLVACGTLFLLQMFYPALNYFMILKSWPVILIILGIEILFETIASRTNEYIYKYDFAAIMMIMMTGVFAMGMAGVDMLITRGYIQ